MQEGEHLVCCPEELAGEQDRVVSLDEHAPTPELLDPAVTTVRVAQSYWFVVGVDTHAATHSYAILDSAGAVLDEQTFPTTSTGIGRARDWIARRTGGDLEAVLVAAEGTGSYGAVLAESLTEVGYRVVEPPTPRRDRGRGKIDAMDATPPHATR